MLHIKKSQNKNVTERNTEINKYNNKHQTEERVISLTLSDPTSNLVRQYDFPVPIRCRKTSDAVFVAFALPLS
jgi:hypothetical protein